MSRQTAGQRWCSLVLLAVFVSLFLFYGLPNAAFRIGRAIEAGRLDAAGRNEPAFTAPSIPAGEAVAEERAALFVQASRSIRPAVVRIEATAAPDLRDRAEGPVPAEPVKRSRGCGVVIDRDGYVLTSRRLVAGAGQIIVFPSRDPLPLSAVVAGSDAGTDLAVLKFDPPPGGVAAAPWGERGADHPDDVQVGDGVMAIGNAYQPGDYIWIGMIGSCGRDVSPALYDIRECIHTTAINPLNCGGPLVNQRGEIIGISTSLRVWGDVTDGVAVRAAVARQVVDDIMRYGNVSRGWLGVFIHTVAATASLASAPSDFHDVSPAAAIDYVVPGSPADRAGLCAGDVLLEFAGAPVESTVELRRHIAAAAPDETFAVTVLRQGAVLEQNVVIGRQPSIAPALPGEREWGIVLLGDLSPADSAKLADDLPGVVVQATAPTCRIEGLFSGCVIVSVNGIPTPSLEAFCREVSPLVGHPQSAPVRLEHSSSGARRTSFIGRK